MIISAAVTALLFTKSPVPGVSIPPAPIPSFNATANVPPVTVTDELVPAVPLVNIYFPLS